jgi:hypothetical protein
VQAQRLSESWRIGILEWAWRVEKSASMPAVRSIPGAAIVHDRDETPSTML